MAAELSFYKLSTLLFPIMLDRCTTRNNDDDGLLMSLYSPQLMPADDNNQLKSFFPFPLFDSLGDLEPRSQHSCSLHYCFPLQDVDQSFSGCRWFIPSPCACWLLCGLHHAL